MNDKGEDSVGLMQINNAVHSDLLASLGLTRASLFDPNTNIMVGTKLLRDAYDTVINALKGRTPPTNIGVLTRLAYKGPNRIASILKQGENPAIRDPVEVNAWNRALAETSALV